MQTRFRVESVAEQGSGASAIWIVQLALMFVHDDPTTSEDDVFARGVRGGTQTLICYTAESAAEFVEGREFAVSFKPVGR